MFDKYRANEITKIYMEKYAELKYLLSIRGKGNIVDEDFKLNSILNIYIEPTNRCNFSCVFCARENMKRKFDMLDIDSYKKSIDSLPTGSYITLTGHGEPTINVNIYDMISYANAKGMFVSLITNASTLNDKNRKLLLESGVSRIQFSFEALDKETNEAIMRGASNFERDLLNILKCLYEIRVQKKNIYVSISRVKIDDSAPYAEVTKAFWERMPVDNYYEGELLSLQTESARYTKQEKEIYKPCANPWISAQINADGTVTACNLDWSNKYVIGNVKEESLWEILNSSKAKKFRKAVLKGDFEYLEQVGYDCYNCNTWRKTVKGNIEDFMCCSMPLRMGLVINEIAGDKPTNTDFLERTIEVLESGEKDLIKALMEE